MIKIVEENVLKFLKNMIFVLMFVVVSIVTFKIIKVDYFITVLGAEMALALGILGIFFPKTMIDLGLRLDRKHSASIFFTGLFLIVITFIRFLLSGK